MAGLGDEYWPSVMDTLREIIPVYDRVNKMISLGRDSDLRRNGIRNGTRRGDRILDAGSGFGNMSSTALGVLSGDAKITLYDPLVPMLNHAGVHFEDTPDASCGIFERMPFCDASFDAVICGYSMRDARDLETAISEMHRVLDTGGRLTIVDLGKPDNVMIRAGVSFYLRCILPVIALAAAGRRGLGFAMLYGTYRRWPKNSALEEILAKQFSRVELSRYMLGGAITATAYK